MLQERLTGKNVCVIKSLVDSDGDIIWRVVPTVANSFPEFVIRSNRNNELSVKIFKSRRSFSRKNYVQKKFVSAALKMVCEYLIKQEPVITPKISIKPPNDFMFNAAKRAGMRHDSRYKRSTLVYNKR